MTTIQQLAAARRYLIDILESRPVNTERRQEVSVTVDELDTTTLKYINRLIEETENAL